MDGENRLALLETLEVGGRTAVTLARMLADALLEPLCGALPMDPARAARPETLNALLAGHGLSGFRDSRLAACRALDLASVSSNCNNLVLDVDWARAPEAVQWRGAVTAPGSSLYLKLPCPERATRAFCGVLRIWRIECEFYRQLAARVPIRVPRPLLAVSKGTRFVLLLEDLNADPGVRLFTNPDMLEGAGLERARRCLTSLARLHASTAALEPREREALMPMALHPFASRRGRAISLALNAGAVEPCRRLAPELMSPDVIALYRRALERWDQMLAAWYAEPLCLIHGDSHLGNFFEHGDEMGMLDWQAAQWAGGLRDVQYFLINSLPEAELAENEGALVRHYVDARVEYGAPMGFDEAWASYRAYSFQALMTEVVSLGLGTLTEQDLVMRTLLERSIAALRRLDFDGWLGSIAG